MLKKLDETNKLGWGVALVGLLIVATPWLLPVCEGLLELVSGMTVPMRCHWTAQAEILLGSLVTIVGLLLAFSVEKETYRKLSLIVLVLGIIVILTPIYFLPTCMSPDMACNLGTKPALILLGGITLLFGLIGIRPEKTSTQE